MDDANNPAEGGLSPALPKQAVAMAISVECVVTGLRLEAPVVESQARDGRSGVDDLPITKLDEPATKQRSSMNEKSFVKSKAMDGRRRVDDRPIHTPAQPAKRNSEQGGEQKTMESACKPGPVRLAA